MVPKFKPEALLHLFRPEWNSVTSLFNVKNLLERFKQSDLRILPDLCKDYKITNYLSFIMTR